MYDVIIDSTGSILFQEWFSIIYKTDSRSSRRDSTSFLLREPIMYCNDNTRKKTIILVVPATNIVVMSPQQTLWLWKRGTISSGASAVSFLLKLTLSVFCSFVLFLFYLYVCNYLHFCCCILYSIVAMSPQQTLWLCLHNKHCGYASITNIVAMSPQQTLWPCLHNKHCGHVSITNIVAMSPQQTLWLCLHNKHCGYVS
jgi:hypothetical protein